MENLTSKVIDTYLKGYISLMPPRGDAILPKEWKRAIHDPNYRLQRYQQQFKAEQRKAAIESSESQCYQYKPLTTSHIRLLQIRPGAKDSPLECSLLTKSLNDDLTFDALSYTWGDPTAVHYICCDGKSLQVTESLWVALPSLRHSTETRCFWIDAVCINQGDVKERSEQVGLMDAIYRLAQQVVVWLGPGTSDTTTAFSLIQQIRRCMAATPADKTFAPISRDEFDKLGLPRVESPEWKALESLFWRPWFMRIWIVQEITLAKRSVVLCGDDSFPWIDLLWVTHFIGNRSMEAILGFNVSPVYPLSSVKASYESGGHLPLLHLLGRFRRSLSSNPSDKIYGLLALATDHQVKVDYSLPYELAFLNFATLLVQESLDVLSHVEDIEWKTSPEIPSWVPDWSTHRYASPFSTFEGPWKGVFNACGSTRSSVCFGADDRTLILRGVIIDNIAYVGHRMPASDRVDRPKHADQALSAAAVSEYMKNLRTKQWRCCELQVLKLGRYPTGEDIESVLHRLLVADAAGLPSQWWSGEAKEPSPEKLDPITRRDALAEAHASWHRFQARFPFEGGGMDSEERAKLQPLAMAYAQAVGWPASGRRLFTTRQGYAGWGPASATKSSIVVLFEGGKTAYVLQEESRKPKPRQKGVTTYNLLGEAYLHGFMNGEGFAGDYSSIEFRIT